MRIGIDASRLRAGSTGVGRYTMGILDPLDQILPDSTFLLFAKRDCNITLPSKRWLIRYDRHPIWSRLPTMLWIRYRLKKLVQGEFLDVFWAPNTIAPKGISKVAPYVATVLDFRHVISPRELPPITRFAHRKWFNSDVNSAAQVVAISEGTSRRMLEILGRPADAIARPSLPKLPPIISQEHAVQMLDALGVRQPFLFTVGRSPCKNLESAVLAVQKLKSRGDLPKYQLIMVGAENGVIQKNLAHLMADFDWVKPLGHVDDATLAALYSLAEALLFPSFYEGFGMPVFEARSMGCRVVATDSPELREAGGEYATYVEPTPEGIIAGLKFSLSRSPPTPSSPVGHDWVDAANAMAMVLQRAARVKG